MFSCLTRCTLLLILVVAAVAAAPKSSEAQVGWYNPATGQWQVRAYRPLFPWRRGVYVSTFRPVVAQPTTVYRPVIATSSCNTCSPCQTTVRYAPQTCYRPQVVSVPTVTYQAMKSCDACTGCCQTVMRPVTTYVRQVRQVAYTTYRPIVSTACASPCTTCASPCSTCGVVGCTSYSTSSCASGQCGVGAASYTQPAYTPTPTPAQPGTTDGSTIERPSLLQQNQKVESQKVPAEGHDHSKADVNPEPAALQDVGGAGLQEIDPPALLNPNDRQARASRVRAATYHQEVQPRLPVQWKVSK